MQDKIIAAIAAYLEGKTILAERWDSKMVETKINWPIPISELATEIAAAIAPLVEAGEPDWENAPHWANWVAQDENGSWFWYENKPNKDLSSWFDKTNGNFCAVNFPSDSWENSLQERPK